jgi:hypothetical protein
MAVKGSRGKTEKYHAALNSPLMPFISPLKPSFS